MATVTATYAWVARTFATDVKITGVAGVVKIAPNGTVNEDAGVRLKGQEFFPAGTYMFRGPGSFTTTPYVELKAPPPFAVADWSIADSATANALTLTISALPSTNGFTLKKFQWTKDAGVTWTDITRKTAGTETLPCGSTGSKTVQLRQLTEQGYSIGSDAKSATVV
jgi:hypothetical protein